MHEFFKKIFKFQGTEKVTPATISYTSYLLKACSLEPVEVGVAAVLPCFWVYWDVGLFIAQSSKSKNPYSKWIETYSGEEFAKSVKEAIHIFDSISKNTTQALKEKMLEAFYKSACLEWHFWNDAYHKVTFDDFSNLETH